MGYLIGTLIGGIILCLFGFKLQKVLICLSWAVLGFAIGSGITGAFADQTASYIAGGVLALLFGMIGFKLYKIGIFVLCFVLTFAVIYNLISNDIVRMVAGLAGGALVGFIGLKFIKPVIIISTSFSAGSMIAEGAASYFAFNSSIIYWIILLVVAIFGVCYQFKTTEKEEIKEA